MLAQFEILLDDPLGSVEVVQHRTRLEKPKDRPKHSAWYGDHPEVRQFEKLQAERVHAMHVIESARAE